MKRILLNALACLATAFAVNVLAADQPAIPAASAEAPLNAYTPLDRDSRLVLAHPFTHVREWKDGVAVHASFAQIIEQNFARRSPPDAAVLLHGLSDLELSHLAQLYTNAVTDGGRTPHLLNILANRLGTGDLSRVADHFGYSAVYSAVALVAPAKAIAFQLSANPASAGPVPGASISVRGVAGIQGVQAAGIGQFLNYTPNEIYLSFRTAPVGALDVAGALYETAGVLVQGIGLGMTIGYYVVGPVVNGLIQTYAPTLYDAIGGTIDNILQNFSAGMTLVETGHWQEGLGMQFGMTPGQISAQENYGGDFWVSQPWEEDFQNCPYESCMAR